MSASQNDMMINDMVIYDSLMGKKRPFVPLHAPKVGMYVCGMTVYDYCHIGHARVMVAFDVIVRWLRYRGYDVTYVRNITDIDDKIIQRANDNNESIHDLTARFITAMHEDADALGCQRPDKEPKATDFIDDMQGMIATLMDRQFAYVGDDGDVYYAVNRFADYGKLSKRKLDDMQAGERVAVAKSKKSPYDFVLWKAAKVGEPQWASPWGAGRPGWHIECSAMSTQCLGNTFDIHGGGHDLQFPHHENEIAQSEAATDCHYANTWIHVGFINVDGEKMSKSLGNFFTIRDVIGKYHPETVRYFILSSHYRSQVNFSDTALDEAHASLSRLYHALKSAEQFFGADTIINNALNNTTLNDAVNNEQTDNRISQFESAMNDDFNVPAALTVLFGLAKELNVAIKNEDKNLVMDLYAKLKYLAMPLNILQSSPQEFLQALVGGVRGDARLRGEQIEAKIQQRADAKASKNYAQADAIRAELLAQGIELEDGRQGTTWRRI